MSARKQQFMVIANLMVVAFAVGIFIWGIIIKHTGILWFYLALFVFSITSYIWGSTWISKYRRKGIYPQKGETTMSDVRRLALSGHRGLSIAAYREITGSSLRKATEEVAKIITEGKKA